MSDHVCVEHSVTDRHRFTDDCYLCEIKHLRGVILNQNTLEATIAELKTVLFRAGGLAEIDRWPERYPRIYGKMVALLEQEN